jgi:alpha-amylase
MARRLALALSLFFATATAAGAAPRTGAKPRSGKPAKAAPAADVEPPKPDRPWTDDVLYFVMIDRFADGDPTNDAGVQLNAPGSFHGGDLKGLIAHLDDIASLGVSALWINPIVKQVPEPVASGYGFPDWPYAGYWADDYDTMDPHFGTEEDLAKLLRECHRRGIKVLLDVVYNHPGYGSHYLEDPKTKNWLRSPDHGECGDDAIYACLSGLPDWKTEETEVDEFLLTKQLAWAKRFPFDGFRLDTVKNVEQGFWEIHRARTRKELGPNFYLLGEVYDGSPEWLNMDYFEKDLLDAAFDFTFQGSTLGFVQGRARPAAYDHYLVARERVFGKHLLAHYLSSHDVTGSLTQLNGDKDLFRLAAVLELTTKGLPVIMYSEEVGQAMGAWPTNRPDMPWGDRKIMPGAGKPRDESLRDFYKRLITIRRSHPALMRGKRQQALVAGDSDVYVFQRTADGDAVVVAMNRGKTAAEASFAAPPEWAKGRVRDMLNDSDVAVKDDGHVTLQLAPRQARIIGVPWQMAVTSAP